MGFQSTLSVRRATRGIAALLGVDEISIHALRKESELRQAFVDDFGLFQSTLSVRRATCSWTFLSTF